MHRKDDKFIIKGNNKEIIADKFIIATGESLCKNPVLMEVDTVMQKCLAII